MTSARPRRTPAGLALALSLCAAPVLAAPSAASPAPAQPIQILLPFAAGGDVDASVRSFLTQAEAFFGQPIEVVPMAGDSGRMAARAVLRAPPDGRTLLAGRVSTLAILPAVEPSTPYRFGDFTLLSLVDLNPLICAVPASSPLRSARDLLAAVRAQPGTLRYATAGHGTLQHVAVAYLLHLAGLPPDAAKPVLFDSGGLAVQAAADGRADLVCGNSLAVLPAIKSGALRGLFDTSPGRLAELPDLPNAREAGVRDMSRIIGWTALVGPPGLPPAVVARWTRFFDEVQWSPEWRATMNRSGALPAVRSPTDAAAFLVDQFEMYRRLAALLHLTREPPPGKAP